MKAIILAGGLGTRLRPLVDDKPKCLAPISGRPFLEYQLLWLRSKGIRQVVLCVGHKMDQVITGIGDGARWEVSVDYSIEEQALGTAGALRLAEPFLAEEEFLTLNGDSMVDLDLNALVAFHRDRRALATLVLVQPSPSPSRRYGTVRLDDTGRILGFVEKGDPDKGREGGENTGWINGGVYLFRKEALGFIPPGTQLSLEEEIFPQWVGHGFYGFTCGGYFIDIGVPEEYLRAQLELPQRFPPS